MKRTLFLLALIVVSAVPVVAQETNEFGFIVGGSRRFVDSGKVQVKRLSLTPSESVQKREREYLRRLAGKGGGEVEIFSEAR